MANTYTGSDVGKAGLNVAEADGSPSVFGVSKINVSNGTLTDNGGGEVTITTGGGGGGSPGGSDGQVQYNNGGSFGGASALAYDDTNNRVGVGTASPVSLLEVNGDNSDDVALTVTNSQDSSNDETVTLRLKSTRGTDSDFEIVHDAFGNTEFFSNQPDTDTEKFLQLANTPKIVFNPDAIDMDFQIASDDVSNMLFVDAGNNRVGIGTGTPSSILHLSEGTSGTPRILLDHDGDQSATANISFLDSTGGGNGQQLGVIDFRGQNSASEEIQYARIRSDSHVYTDASERGRLIFEVQRQGVLTEGFRIGGLEVSVNEGGNDVNFKVEGNNDDPLFFCDAGNDRVGIGISTPACELDVRAGNDSGFVDFRVSRDDNQYTGFRNSDASGGYLINHSRESNKKPLYIDSVHNSAGSAAGDNNILFRTGALSSPTERMRILSSNGNVGIGVTAPAQKLHVSGTIRQTASTSSVLVSNANGDIVSSSNVQDLAYLETVGTFFPELTTPQPALPNSTIATALIPKGYIQVDVGGAQYLLPAYQTA